MSTQTLLRERVLAREELSPIVFNKIFYPDNKMKKYLLTLLQQDVIIWCHIKVGHNLCFMFYEIPDAIFSCTLGWWVG